ncbi:MAG TPA: endonuclease/exonuclease/phosphatase family protein [Solirubrobacterales bacterium]|nr:endonuclease/exonuclease/phosphatase family protein [Solirubrobacterales bacterium]
MIHRSAPARRVFAALSALAIALVALAGVAEAKPQGKAKGTVVNVMTRNLYLGADLTPAIESKSTSEFIEANGAIYRQLEATNFPVRAKGLAEEILEKGPDLVGLQEVALWRTAPPSLGPVFSGRPEATTVKYDFLKLLLAQLNERKRLYKPVVVQDEFDFEAPADANGQPGDGPGGGTGILANAETNARLTMRDAILMRLHSGVKVGNPKSGHFEHLLVEKVAGSKEISVTRGWTSIDATVRGSKKFHFVDTHLEAFDNPAEVPSVRAQQASELVAPGGPATSRLPVILVGDLNSDVKTEVKPGDGQAYRVLLGAGFRERATDKPTGCCIDGSYDLRTGSAAEMNHKVDHIMTDTPKKVKLVSSAVTGRTMHHGYWDSDHAGLFSSLRILR